MLSLADACLYRILTRVLFVFYTDILLFKDEIIISPSCSHFCGCFDRRNGLRRCYKTCSGETLTKFVNSLCRVLEFWSWLPVLSPH